MHIEFRMNKQFTAIIYKIVCLFAIITNPNTDFYIIGDICKELF